MAVILSELQSKYINERILLLETCMGNLCETFGKIARKNARLRDTNDHLVSIINEYSGKEKINTSTKKGLVNFSSFLSAVEDYRHAMVNNVILHLKKIDIFYIELNLKRLKESRKKLYNQSVNIRSI